MCIYIYMCYNSTSDRTLKAPETLRTESQDPTGRFLNGGVSRLGTIRGTSRNSRSQFSSQQGDPHLESSR